MSTEAERKDVRVSNTAAKWPLVWLVLTGVALILLVVQRLYSSKSGPEQVVLSRLVYDELLAAVQKGKECTKGGGATGDSALKQQVTDLKEEIATLKARLGKEKCCEENAELQKKNDALQAELNAIKKPQEGHPSLDLASLPSPHDDEDWRSKPHSDTKWHGGDTHWQTKLSAWKKHREEQIAAAAAADDGKELLGSLTGDSSSALAGGFLPSGRGTSLEILTIATEHGKIRARLRPDVAPKTVAGVKELISEGKYDNCVFYRAEPSFVLQGGLRTKDGEVRHGKSLPLEYKLANKRGTLTMARWQDPDSASGEFFVNLADSPHLDRTGDSGWALGFTVFAEIVEGMDTADRMSQLPTVTQNGLKMLKEPIVFEMKVEDGV